MAEAVKMKNLLMPLCYFTVTLDPYLFWGLLGFLMKAAKRFHL